MDAGNSRPTHGAAGVVIDPFMESGDWRAQLKADSRERIVRKILDTLKRHLPFAGHEGLEELQKIAVRFEEKMLTAATSQSEYLRKISLKMMTMETRAQNPIPDPMQANSNHSDPGADHKDGVVVDPPQDNDTGSSQNLQWCVTCGTNLTNISKFEDDGSTQHV